MFRYAILLCLISGYANAHQFLPTYPVFQHSFVDGVMYTKMEIFNKRKEIEFYELGVYDSDWKPISFASENKLIRINYLQTKEVNVYVKKEDLKKLTYICSESRIKKEDVQSTVISSRICSKVK
jgi:hypothetical protein